MCCIRFSLIRFSFSSSSSSVCRLQRSHQTHDLPFEQWQDIWVLNELFLYWRLQLFALTFEEIPVLGKIWVHFLVENKILCSVVVFVWDLPEISLFVQNLFEHFKRGIFAVQFVAVRHRFITKLVHAPCVTASVLITYTGQWVCHGDRRHLLRLCDSLQRFSRLCMRCNSVGEQIRIFREYNRLCPVLSRLVELLTLFLCLSLWFRHNSYWFHWFRCHSRFFRIFVTSMRCMPYGLVSISHDALH